MPDKKCYDMQIVNIDFGQQNRGSKKKMDNHLVPKHQSYLQCCCEIQLNYI